MNPSLRLESRQVMAFAIYQALHILQMPQLELAEWIQTEIERNPLLEWKHSSSSSFVKTPIEAPALPSLREHLLAQAREAFPHPADLQLAIFLIDHFDDRGRLALSLKNSKAQKVLAKIQTFDPPGIGARNLQESFLLQLRAQPYSLAEIIVRDHFQDLLAARFKTIQKQLRLSTAELQKALYSISRLQIRPVSYFEHPFVQPLIPDLTLQETEQGWFLKIEEDELPLFRIRTDYINLCNSLPREEEKETVRGWLTSARWLSRCLKRRRNTLQTIGQILLETQKAFLNQIREITPVKIQDLASALKVHPSTAWRAVRNKTLACPRGLIPLQHFFSELSASNSIKELLSFLIDQENKTQPLTDEGLMQALKKKGIVIARRTVAKYRHELQIAPAAQRKIFGKM